MRRCITLATVLLLACGNGGSSCPVGSEGCECTGGGGCDPPLDCVDGVCVSGEDAGTDPSTDPLLDVADETECTMDSDCDDDDPCTVDTCDEVGSCWHEPLDGDEDGYVSVECEGTDCDDTRDDVYPGAPELECDGTDNDCNGDDMDGVTDEDDDGYIWDGCTGGTDCQDDNDLAYPGASIVDCSMLDNNCNGHPDHDDDGDGHVSYLCTGGDDCDDADVTVLDGECTGVNDCCDGCWQRNGCWYDETTGYMWEDPPLSAASDWDASVAYCDALSLAGRGAGEWHLPTVSEYRTLLRGCPATEEGGACGVTDTCLLPTCYGSDCYGCTYLSGPGAGGRYWDPALDETLGRLRCYSSSPYSGTTGIAWGIDFDNASVMQLAMTATRYGVRCVHTGS